MEEKQDSPAPEPLSEEMPAVSQEDDNNVKETGGDTTPKHAPETDNGDESDSDDEEYRYLSSFRRGPKASLKYAKTMDSSTTDVKRDELEIIRTFEAKRIAHYEIQSSNQIQQWQLMKDLAKHSKEEAACLLLWLKTRIAAQKKYAAVLAGVNDKVSGLKKGTSKKHIKSNTQVPQGKPVKKRNIAVLGAAGSQCGNGKLLDELCGMDHSSAKQIMEHLKILEENFSTDLKQRHATISTEVEISFVKGDYCMSRLKMFDKHVAKMYNAYLSVAAKFLPDVGPINSNMKDKKCGSDMWVADMRYRVAVFQQRAAWQGCISFMKKIFNELINFELSRRSTTKKALEDMMRAEAGIFGKAPEGFENVSKCLLRLEVDPSQLQAELEESHSIKFAPIVEGEETEYIFEVPDFLNELNGALNSPLITSSAILMRKAKGHVKGTVVPSIVVLTVDNHLHLFDCKDAVPGEDPKEAFSVLVPIMDTSTANMESKPKKIDKKFVLNPSLTLNLACYIAGARRSQKKPEHANNFHIHEVKKNDGIKGMFKKESFIKASLRASSEQERDEWLAKIEAISSD